MKHSFYLEEEMINKEEFWHILNDRCKEPYIRKFIKDLSNMKSGVSEDDIISDCYLYFILDDCKRLKKIQNDNGAKIAILNRFRNVYRKYKNNGNGIVYIDEYYTEQELVKIKELCYTDFQKRLATFFLGRVNRLNRLNVNHQVNSHRRPKLSWYKRELVSLILKTDRKHRVTNKQTEFMKWCDIEDSQLNLLLYFKSGSERIKNYNIDEKYLRGNRIDDGRAIICLKNIYSKMMETVWNDINGD